MSPGLVEEFTYENASSSQPHCEVGIIITTRFIDGETQRDELTRMTSQPVLVCSTHTWPHAHRPCSPTSLTPLGWVGIFRYLESLLWPCSSTPSKPMSLVAPFLFPKGTDHHYLCGPMLFHQVCLDFLFSTTCREGHHHPGEGIYSPASPPRIPRQRSPPG